MQPGTKEYLLVKEEVRKVLSKGKAARVLRLVFHDAGTFDIDCSTGGMNGSIVYEHEKIANTRLASSLNFLNQNQRLCSGFARKDMHFKSLQPILRVVASFV